MIVIIRSMMIFYDDEFNEAIVLCIVTLLDQLLSIIYVVDTT